MDIQFLRLPKHALCFLLAVAPVCSVFGQGRMVFGNNFASSTTNLKAPVYGPNPNNPSESRQGNAADGRPPGTQSYGGALLAGTGYTAALYTMLGESFIEIQRTYFLTGKVSGYWSQQTAVDPNHPPGATVTAIVRVWDNHDGTISNWDQAMASSAMLGESAPFTVTNLGSNLPLPFPTLTDGVRSFNIHARSGAFIVSHPENLIAAPGATSQFHVGVASGVGPPSFQWQRDGADIPGATGSTLGLTNVQYTDAGGYSVLVSVPSVTLASRVARLRVQPRIADIGYNLVPEWGAVALRLAYDSMAQSPVRVEVRSTLSDTWINMGQFTNSTVRGFFFDIGPTNDQRFYRLSIDP